MNEDLTELYREIILDHNRNPRNARPLENPTHLAEGFNPLCGDEVRIFLNIQGGQISEVTFEGQGCAISRASASLLTQKLQGLSIDQVRQRCREVYQLLTDSGSHSPEGDLEHLGDLVALKGVRQFPARIKCATLPWHTFEAALSGKTQRVSTEGDDA